uniref:NADH dehydrogenase subunit 1 n=1 Tax=Hydroides elegans TaxID=216498 RepID=UPI001FA7C13C|nr:NADH dehydrogenase subunit 1 [Hydroides elegans]UNA71679.1 NADH dehydrogenase subunit 1 [Hydroides elegans]
MILWVEYGLSEVYTCLGVLLATAWCTLLERKVLASAQRRKGPNKVVLKGIIQPLADALKLFLKKQVIPSRSNLFLFSLMPCLALTVSLFLWQVWPESYGGCSSNYEGLIYICIVSFHIYAIVGAGWAANSIYSILGSLRGVAQTISYELPYNLTLLGLFFWLSSYSFMGSQANGYFLSHSEMVFPIWVMLLLCELHRTPFDLTEAESELVSGYNTDYGAVGFIQLFISEYANVVFSGQLTSLLWFWGGFTFVSVLFGVFLSGLFLFYRAVFPRCRYDQLMEVCWKVIFPFILLWFILSISGVLYL